MNKTQIQVLLIEDTPSDALLLREALENDTLTAFTLTTVERLSSAIEILSSQSFDIILLDLGLPDSHGMETFTRIQQVVPFIPKVILSGFTDEVLAMQAVQAGAQDYLVKGAAGFSSATRAIRYAIERQRSQQALRASEERFRAMIENGLDDISLLDAQGKLIWESPAVVRNLGYPENVLIGQNIFEIVHPDDKAWTTALYTKLIQEPGSRQEAMFRLQRSDGSWRWVEAIVTNLLDNPSVRAIVVNYRDITERKEAQEIIRRNEETLAQAGKMAHLGAWEIEVNNVEDLNSNPLHWSDEVYRIFGYEPGTVEVTNDLFFGHIHPDDQPKIQRAVSQAIAGKNSYHIEHRIVRSDGVERIVEEHARLVFDKSGKLVQLLGAVQDITERKEAEATIRSLAKFPAENPNPILRIAEDGKIIYANPASRHWLAAWKLTLNDSLPKEWQALVTDAYQRNTKQGFDISIQDSTYAITIVPFREEGYTNIYGRDISERKQAEEELRISQKLLQDIIDKTSALIYIVDISDRFLLINHKLEMLFGHKNSAVVGQSRNAFLPDEIVAQHRNNDLEIIRTGAGKTFEEESLEPDGRHVYLTTKFPLFDMNNNLYGVCGISTDMTERKLAEEKTQQQLYELKRWHEVTLDRETRVLELKTEINELLQRLNEPPRYTSIEQASTKGESNE